MNCQQCQQLLSDFIDNALSTADDSAVNDHLLRCATCYDLQVDLRAIVFHYRKLKWRYESHSQAPRLNWSIRNSNQHRIENINSL